MVKKTKIHSLTKKTKKGFKLYAAVILCAALFAMFAVTAFANDDPIAVVNNLSTFIFGIGVDYSIFVMNGLTSDNDNKLHYHKTAILLSAVTLITTVSSMLLANHPAIRSVGFSTLVGLLSAVILAYVLQPAVYRWLNRQKK